LLLDDFALAAERRREAAINAANHILNKLLRICGRLRYFDRQSEWAARVLGERR